MSTALPSKYPAMSRSLIGGYVIAGAGALVFNTFPMFLSAIANHLALSDAQLGVSGTCYLVGFALPALFAGFWMPRANWRAACLLAYALILTSIVGLWASQSTRLLFVAMSLLGAGACIIFTIGLTLISRARDPDRSFGISFVVQSIIAALLVFAMTKIIIDKYGFGGFCLGLVAFYGASVLAISSIPENFLKAETSLQQVPTAGRRSINFAAWLASVALFIQFGAFSAVWGFLERIGLHDGVNAATVDTVLTASIGAAIVGALAAAALGNRFGQLIPLSIGFILTIAAVLFAKVASGLVAFAIVACTVNALLQYVTTYQMGLIAATDYTGNFTVMMSFIFASGGALGPALAGAIVERGGFSEVFAGICAVTAVSWLLTLTVARMTRTRGQVS